MNEFHIEIASMKFQKILNSEYCSRIPIENRNNIIEVIKLIATTTVKGDLCLNLYLKSSAINKHIKTLSSKFHIETLTNVNKFE